MNKTMLAIGCAFVILGAVFSFLPHEAHNEVLGLFVHDDAEDEHHEHGSHDLHQKLGVVIVLAGLALVTLGGFRT